MEEAQNTIAHWECNFCGQREGVENGICPKCGPTQTTPLSEEAKKEAGVEEAAKNREQATVQEPVTATSK